MRYILTFLAGSKARHVSSESVVAELHDEALEQVYPPDSPRSK
jgi:hypothetical protein